MIDSTPPNKMGVLKVYASAEQINILKQTYLVLLRAPSWAKRCFPSKTTEHPNKPVVTIVPLLFHTLFGKRGIFTRSPLPWVFCPLSFSYYHVVDLI